MSNIGNKSNFSSKVVKSGLMETILCAVISFFISGMLTYFPTIAASAETQTFLAKFAFSFAVFQSIAIFFRVWQYQNDQVLSARDQREHFDERLDKLADLIGQTPFNQLLKDELKSSSDDTFKTLKDISIVSFLGDLGAGHDYVAKNAPSSKEIWNVQIGTHRKDDIDHHGESLELTAKLIAESVCDGVIWHEIYSSQTADRAAKIKGFITSKKKDRLSRYAPRILIKDVPSVNFIILDYDQKPQEVLFGFSLHEMSGYNSIFISKDARLVNHFKNYFNALSRDDYTEAAR